MAPSKRLAEHAPLLIYLAKKPTLSKTLLASPQHSRQLVHSVSECAANVLRGNVNLTPNQKRKLSFHKEGLRSIAKKSTPLSKKQQIIQRGGFLGALLGPLVGSVLLPLAKKVFG
jgi:hypothetical protein